MKNQWLIAVIMAMACTQVHAVNKCSDATGKVTFQDAPCTGKGEQINVRPASGHADATAEQPSGAASAPGKKISGSEKMYEALKDERTRREKWVVMNEARAKLVAAQRQCDQEQARLAASKAYSNNNLAGATRDVSISGEMTAAATACGAKTRGIEREVEAAEKVCAEIKCIAAY